jgi:hypothetical protein
MVSVHKFTSRFAAFLLLTAAVGLPLSIAVSSHHTNSLPPAGLTTLAADGTLPPPPPKKQLT